MVFKLDPQINKFRGNKSSYQESTILNKGKLMRINQGSLLKINKQILLRNENGYRFHSHQSTANLNLRTQSATIPNTLIAKVLYIYKKWKCVEMLTYVASWLTGLKVFANMGTSHSYMPIEHTQT